MDETEKMKVLRVDKRANILLMFSAIIVNFPGRCLGNSGIPWIIQGVSGGIVNILGGGSMDYSE